MLMVSVVNREGSTQRTIMDDEITGRDIIEEILEHMEKNQHPLLYSTLVPGLYQISLHPDDFVRLEVIFPRIVAEATRALEEKVRELNKGSFLPRLNKQGSIKYENAQGEWYVEFEQDNDEEIEKAGDFLVRSQLVERSRPEYGAGTKTISLKTSRTRGQSKIVEKGQGRIYAKISYEDDSGNQNYLMTKEQIVIGRGGREYWVDLKLYAVDDISRNHLRLRFDESTGQFLIKDISLLGTTVNGQKIPSSLETVNGTTRDLDREISIPSSAQIGLADKVFLEFNAFSEK